ncbi:rna-directed dna polymerase from mobile element jockey-like [Willisornis vidua]|uniref:Rna-directed dna polymerase from mobile element jockey-like n=1 Tax=Willisornis vidua TaxID=1566151 RepID=A0ABQ9DL59_9PASS|nr:rna-directed dna polymerase from mobile element jockey-like [Willisornis vidua]
MFVARVVPQGSTLRPVLFSIFINDVSCSIEYTLSKFADNTKLTHLKEKEQRDLNKKFEKWAHGNPIRFNKAKFRVLHLSWGKPQYQYKLEEEWSERSPVQKDFGVLVDKSQEMRWQLVCAAQKANHYQFKPPFLRVFFHSLSLGGGPFDSVLSTWHLPS